MPHFKFIIAGGLIIGAITMLMVTGINESMVYYYTVSEVLAKSNDLKGDGIRVSGHVAIGSIEKPGPTQVEFTVIEKATGKTLRVAYAGEVPDTFKERAEVVVEGKYLPDQQIFAASTLLAKCPSKYESSDAEGEGTAGAEASSY